MLLTLINLFELMGAPLLAKVSDVYIDARNVPARVFLFCVQFVFVYHQVSGNVYHLFLMCGPVYTTAVFITIGAVSVGGCMTHRHASLLDITL